MLRRPPSRRERGSSLAEAAITMPVVIMLSLALINLSMAGFAAINAANAANFGARRGSVAQAAPCAQAVEGANQSLSAASGGGAYQVSASNCDSQRGGMVKVTVSWSVPNYFSGLAALFGGTVGEFKGSAVSSFRKEGW